MRVDRRMKWRGWAAAWLLAAGLLLSGMCAGPCVAAWTHEVHGDYDVWYLNGDQRFQYHLTNHQWWHFATVNSNWYVLSATGRPETNFCETGAWFALGTGLYYRFDETHNYGFFSEAPSYRFYYQYGPGQWYNAGYGGSWHKLGNAGLAGGMVDGNWYDLGTGLKYRYDVGSDYGFFLKGTAFRFHYRYTPGQWYDSGYGGGWYQLGNVGRAAGMVDGNWYDLGTGLKYRYDSTNDYGFYGWGPSYRFYYKYAPGQWYNSGYGGGWYLLGNAGRATGMVDGNWHALGTGLDYRYDAAHDFGYFGKDLGYRFYYRYGPGQWYDSGYGGGWYALGPDSRNATVIVDGDGPYDLGNGFNFNYNVTEDRAYFLRGSANRFSYTFDTGQWRHNGALEGWGLLGSEGRNGHFIADGAWNWIADGAFWYYCYYYDAGNDAGFWARGAGAEQRFSYFYSDSPLGPAGQWKHYDTVGGSNVIGAPVSLSTVAFMGDGQWHADDPDDPYTWWYSYDWLGDRALWDRSQFGGGSQLRFSYAYETGQWGHIAGISGSLGEALLGDPTDLTAMRFIGLEAAHQVVTGGQPWWYAFDYWGNSGLWSRVNPSGLADYRFQYDYQYGTWYHKEEGYLFFAAVLGASTGSRLDAFTSFVGEGGVGQVDTAPIWYYQYLYSSDAGFWARGAGAEQRFSYFYSDSPLGSAGQWKHYDTVGGSNVIGAPLSLSAFGFVGDGGWHADNPDTNYWWYSYDYANDQALWDRAGDGTQVRFSYAYTTGQWGHIAGVSGDLGTAILGFPTNLTVMRFIGLYDAQQIVSGGQPWWYRYVYLWDDGYWSQVNPSGWSDYRFAYDYTNGTWSHKELGTETWVVLGAEAGSMLGAANGGFTSFAGDFSWGRVNGSPVWYYQYFRAGNTGRWSRTAGFTDWRFAYNYNARQWYHVDSFEEQSNLIGAPVSLDELPFMGDGRPHRDNPDELTWWYHYDYGLDKAFWDQSAAGDGSFLRFSYLYKMGQWGHIAGMEGGDLGQANLGDPINLYVMRFIGLDTPQQIVFGDQPWWYGYDRSQHIGLWSQVNPPGLNWRFGYRYGTGKWIHKKAGVLNFVTLGAETGSPLGQLLGGFDSFAGDGSWGRVDAGPSRDWYYQYDRGSDTGFWSRTPGGWPLVFSYEYSSQQWSHHDWFSGVTTLGSATSLVSRAFVGDGDYFSLGAAYSNAWSYAYDYANNKGKWYRSASPIAGDVRFSYAYATGIWSHEYDSGGGITDTAPINPGLFWSLSSLGFIGETAGAWTEVATGTWWYLYLYSSDLGHWSRNSGPGQRRFALDVGNRQWYLFEFGANKAMGNDQQSMAFIGDGARHEVVGGATWKVLYDTLYDQLKIIHNGEASDATYNYVAYDWLGSVWFDSYSIGGAQQANVMVTQFAPTPGVFYQLWSAEDQHVIFQASALDYYMDYTLVGSASQRLAVYSWVNQPFDPDYSYYTYNDQQWRLWDGASWVLTGDPGAPSDEYRP